MNTLTSVVSKAIFKQLRYNNVKVITTIIYFEYIVQI